MRTSLLIVVLAAVSVGCVGKGKYNSLKADYDLLITEHTELAARLKACEMEPEPPPPPDANRK